MHLVVSFRSSADGAPPRIEVEKAPAGSLFGGLAETFRLSGVLAVVSVSVREGADGAYILAAMALPLWLTLNSGTYQDAVTSAASAWVGRQPKGWGLQDEDQLLGNRPGRSGHGPGRRRLVRTDFRATGRFDVDYPIPVRR